MGRTSSTPDYGSTYEQGSPEQAFDGDSKRMSESSDPRRTASAATLQVVTIEPSVGGSINVLAGAL
jgi:hypothetical protein